MGQVLHGNARTTEAIRREIRNSQESLMKLAKRFNVNHKIHCQVEKAREPCITLDLLTMEPQHKQLDGAILKVFDGSSSPLQISCMLGVADTFLFLND